MTDEQIIAIFRDHGIVSLDVRCLKVADRPGHKIMVAVGRAILETERDRCARIADDEARIREEAGQKHPEDSEGRDRCFAGARAAANVAKGIRAGEVLPEPSKSR